MKRLIFDTVNGVQSLKVKTRQDHDFFDTMMSQIQK